MGVYDQIMKWPLFAISLILCASIAQARPVSYPGGWTVITENDADENSALLHYTLTPRVSVGYRMAYDRMTHETFHGAQMNNLLKRWNMPDAQANIYLKSAIGFAERPEGFVGVQTDWETRRHMVMYENRATFSPNDQKQRFNHSVGFGIAPYVAEAGALHTWIMPHVLYQPEDNKKWQFTPMLRFFKDSVLVEGGYNMTIKKPILNATIRF